MEMKKRLEKLVSVLNELKSLTVATSTGKKWDSDDHSSYILLRKQALELSEDYYQIPKFIRDSKSLTEFWHFISSKESKYQGRRTFLFEWFNEVTNRLEQRLSDLDFSEELQKRVSIWLREGGDSELADSFDSCSLEVVFTGDTYYSGDREIESVDATIYAPRKTFDLFSGDEISKDLIWLTLEKMLPNDTYLSGKEISPLVSSSPMGDLSTRINAFGSESINLSWRKALERANSDPEGAITLSKTLVEDLCKHILDNEKVSYSETEDLPSLYHKVAEILKLAPKEHDEKTFKKILQGMASSVQGLAEIRNLYGDSHGGGKKRIRPKSRHANLAVNISCGIVLFLIETYEASDRKKE